MPTPDPIESPLREIGGFDRSGASWVLVLFGVGGAGLGALIPVLAGWAAELPWVPFQGPLELLGSFDDTWLVWGRPLIGLVAGLAFAGWTIFDTPVLRMSTTEIQVQRRGETERVISREAVDAVYRKGGSTVVESATGRRLFEGDIEDEREVIRDAFLALGYPWEGSRD